MVVVEPLLLLMVQPVVPQVQVVQVVEPRLLTLEVVVEEVN